MRSNLFWLSDEQWAGIELHLPRDVRRVERVDDRRVIYATFLPCLKSRRASSLAGSCTFSRAVVAGAIARPNMVHRPLYNRFVRWARRGLWENMFRDLADVGERNPVLANFPEFPGNARGRTERHRALRARPCVNDIMCPRSGTTAILFKQIAPPDVFIRIAGWFEADNRNRF
jgi:transposase